MSLTFVSCLAPRPSIGSLSALFVSAIRTLPFRSTSRHLASVSEFPSLVSPCPLHSYLTLPPSPWYSFPLYFNHPSTEYTQRSVAICHPQTLRDCPGVGPNQGHSKAVLASHRLVSPFALLTLGYIPSSLLSLSLSLLFGRPSPPSDSQDSTSF